MPTDDNACPLTWEEAAELWRSWGGRDLLEELAECWGLTPTEAE